jgi:hypothetical protein
VGSGRSRPRWSRPRWSRPRWSRPPRPLRSRPQRRPRPFTAVCTYSALLALLSRFFSFFTSINIFCFQQTQWSICEISAFWGAGEPGCLEWYVESFDVTRGKVHGKCFLIREKTEAGFPTAKQLEKHVYTMVFTAVFGRYVWVVSGAHWLSLAPKPLLETTLHCTVAWLLRAYRHHFTPQ